VKRSVFILVLLTAPAAGIACGEWTCPVARLSQFSGVLLFLAAPMETAPPIIDASRKLIESLSARLVDGERFSDLMATRSEDEATKNCGGDLDYFSVFRMPPDFFETVTKLNVGQITPPIRTRLGSTLCK
jgi:PPIC-type PPIASE domain